MWEQLVFNRLYNNDLVQVDKSFLLHLIKSFSVQTRAHVCTLKHQQRNKDVNISFSGRCLHLVVIDWTSLTDIFLKFIFSRKLKLNRFWELAHSLNASILRGEWRLFIIYLVFTVDILVFITPLHNSRITNVSSWRVMRHYSLILLLQRFACEQELNFQVGKLGSTPRLLSVLRTMFGIYCGFQYTVKWAGSLLSCTIRDNNNNNNK